MSWRFRWRSREPEPPDPGERALLERARSLPREIEPGRDLWLGIRQRIEQGERERRATPTGWRAGLRVPAWAAAALAALLVGTGLGAGLWLGTPGTPLDDPAAVQALAASLRDRDGVAQVRSHLLALLDERRGQLPPDLVATLERNLLEIDRAIAEIHLALEAHPGSPALQFLLAEAYRSEAEMLEQLEWWTRGPGAEGRS